MAGSAAWAACEDAANIIASNAAAKMHLHADIMLTKP
jgi:hypothetical protein